MGWKSFYAKHVKYTLSRVIGWTGIILFWWLFLIIAVLIRLDDPSGPALFIGVYSDDNDPRVTRLGRFLRAASLDELPQLINLAKGDMALIGFRSPLTYHPWPWSEYTKEQKKMFLLKPGITGWAQVHGRRTVEWHDRIRMNNWYADHVSFLLDLRIFFMTIFKVIENKDNENIGETVKKEK